MTTNTKYHNYITKRTRNLVIVQGYLNKTSAIDLIVATISDIILKPISSFFKNILKDYKIVD